MPRRRADGFVNYPLKHVALGLLMREPKHGYALYRDFEQQFGAIWKAGQTKFYVALSGLQDDGFLEAHMEPQEDKADRKVYHLTQTGRRAFVEWLGDPVTSMRAVRVELIAKLRFYNLLALPGADALIDSQVAVLTSMQAEWRAEPVPPDDPFYAVVQDFRIRQADFIVEWLTAPSTRKHLTSE